MYTQFSDLLFEALIEEEDRIDFEDGDWCTCCGQFKADFPLKNDMVCWECHLESLDKPHCFTCDDTGIIETQVGVSLFIEEPCPDCTTYHDPEFDTYKEWWSDHRWFASGQW